MKEDQQLTRALYITRAVDLKHYDDSFSRVYFGNEFCQRLLPTAPELLQVMEFVHTNNINFTFLTPYVTEEGLKKLDPLFQEIDRGKPGSEVVFNDWGVLRVLKEKHNQLERVMGRLLNKMKRGPRLMNLLDAMPPSTNDYFQSCSLDSPLYRQFLINNGIRRVELDNTLQGISLNLSSPDLQASLYLPYAYITTTRLCMANSCDVQGKADEIGIFPCKRECRQYTFQLSHPVMPVPLLSKGNTVFLKNEKMPREEALRTSRIDRIVIEPDLPI